MLYVSVWFWTYLSSVPLDAESECFSKYLLQLVFTKGINLIWKYRKDKRAVLVFDHWVTPDPSLWECQCHCHCQWSISPHIKQITGDGDIYHRTTNHVWSKGTADPKKKTHFAYSESYHMQCWCHSYLLSTRGLTEIGNTVQSFFNFI